MSTVVELRQKAKILGVKGYSKMNKGDLEKAIQKAVKPVGLSNDARISNYRRQGGGMGLTPRQARRHAHKANKRAQAKVAGN